VTSLSCTCFLLAKAFNRRCQQGLQTSAALSFGGFIVAQRLHNNGRNSIISQGFSGYSLNATLYVLVKVVGMPSPVTRLFFGENYWYRASLVILYHKILTGVRKDSATNLALAFNLRMHCQQHSRVRGNRRPTNSFISDISLSTSSIN
jgi:hypothetical protein